MMRLLTSVQIMLWTACFVTNKSNSADPPSVRVDHDEFSATGTAGGRPPGEALRRQYFPPRSRAAEQAYVWPKDSMPGSNVPRFTADQVYSWPADKMPGSTIPRFAASQTFSWPKDLMPGTQIPPWYRLDTEAEIHSIRKRLEQLTSQPKNELPPDGEE